MMSIRERIVIQNECEHVAQGAPATMVVHLFGLDDYVCDACYTANYQENEACTLVWEADPIGDDASACGGFGCVDTCGDCTPCPFCPDMHAPGKCPVAATLTGAPLIAGLRAELAEAHIRLAEYRSLNALVLNTLKRYADEYGPLSDLKEDE